MIIRYNQNNRDLLDELNLEKYSRIENNNRKNNKVAAKKINPFKILSL
ncbi:MAG: hypothetical protein HOI06_07715 [Pelagibacteraceae bacterium]|nr:hypothetical protein [Pelagibacteraceae bacterium]